MNSSFYDTVVSLPIFLDELMYTCSLIFSEWLAITEKELVLINRSVVYDSCPGSSGHGFPRQKHWSGLPFPSPGDLPDPEIKPVSLTSPALAGGFFTASATGEAPCEELFLVHSLADFYLQEGSPLSRKHAGFPPNP